MAACPTELCGRAPGHCTVNGKRSLTIESLSAYLNGLDWQQYASEPAVSTLLTALAVLLVLALLGRLLTSLMLRLARAFPLARQLSENLDKPLRLLLPLAGLQVVWTAAPETLAYIGLARHLTLLAIIGGFTWLGLGAIRAVEQLVIIRNPVTVADNLRARRIQTQTRVLVRTLGFFVLLLGSAAMLMTFPSARELGTSLLASAGLVGLAVGFAARPVLANLIAGLQIAFTQPIRLDDVVIIENEWGRIEEITGTYVIVRIWDDRRLVVPLQYFLDNPFQNWTRNDAGLIGAVFLWADYSLPLEPLREELRRLVEAVPELWDQRVCVLQVVDSSERALQLRALVSSGDSSRNWDLRCHVRENLVGFIARHHPHCLPQLRADLKVGHPDSSQAPPPNPEPERQPPV